MRAVSLALSSFAHQGLQGLASADSTFGFTSSAVVQGEHAEDLGTWTLSQFERVCVEEGNQCDFSFLIAEGDSRKATHCSFAVTGNDDTPASQLDFSEAKCRETEDYSINCGWDQDGFIVFVVSNVTEGLMSYFGFLDADLESGLPVDLKTGKVRRRPLPAELESELSVRQEPPSLQYASEWTITDVSRYTSETDDGPMTNLSFIIEHPDFESETCQVTATGEAGQDLETMSFFDLDCDRGDWAVSWGYNEEAEEDVAIMTLMNKNHDRRAYFGWRGVNDDVRLRDNGPQPSHPY